MTSFAGRLCNTFCGMLSLLLTPAKLADFEIMPGLGHIKEGSSED